MRLTKTLLKSSKAHFPFRLFRSTLFSPKGKDTFAFSPQAIAQKSLNTLSPEERRIKKFFSRAGRRLYRLYGYENTRELTACMSMQADIFSVKKLAGLSSNIYYGPWSLEIAWCPSQVLRKTLGSRNNFYFPSLSES